MTYESDQKEEPGGVGLAFDIKKTGTVLEEKGLFVYFEQWMHGVRRTVTRGSE